jgi:hypothetical protein
MMAESSFSCPHSGIEAEFVHLAHFDPLEACVRRVEHVIAFRRDDDRRHGQHRRLSSAESLRCPTPGVRWGRLSRHALRDDSVPDPAHIFDLCGSDLRVEQLEWHLAAEGTIRPAQTSGSGGLGPTQVVDFSRNFDE